MQTACLFVVCSQIEELSALPQEDEERDDNWKQHVGFKADHKYVKTWLGTRSKDDGDENASSFEFDIRSHFGQQWTSTLRSACKKYLETWYQCAMNDAEANYDPETSGHRGSSKPCLQIRRSTIVSNAKRLWNIKLKLPNPKPNKDFQFKWSS